MNAFTVAELIGEIKTLTSTLKKINKEVFNARDAAEYLCISYDTILRLARIDDIEYVKNGSSYIFRKKHLDEWLDRKEKLYRRQRL